MSHQCVPNWDLDDDFSQPFFLNHKNTSLAAAAASFADYEVAELTWKDGGLAMLGLRQPARIEKPTARYPSPVASAAGGTLECIVDQARRPAAVDAVVPSDNHAVEKKRLSVNGKNCAIQESSKTANLAAAVMGSRKSTSATENTCGQMATVGTDQIELSVMPSGSPASEGDEEGGGGSPETVNRSIDGKRSFAVDHHDSVRRRLRSEQDESRDIGTTSISTKRSRVAAVHNQSERKRRDRINEKMKTLQKLLPNSSKTDKASMLDEVIEYLKLLQAHIHTMNKISTISPMILPVTLQQQQQQQQHQFQMSMMARMSHMSMGLGMVDPGFLGGQGNVGLAPPSMPHPSFLSLQAATAAAGACDAPAIDLMQQLGNRVFPDMSTSSMGCPTQHQQQMSAEVYTRMAALYQQIYGCNQKI